MLGSTFSFGVTIPGPFIGLRFFGSSGSPVELGLTGAGAGVLGIMFENSPKTDDMDGPAAAAGFGGALEVCGCSEAPMEFPA